MSLIFLRPLENLNLFLFLALIASWKRCWCTRQTEGRRIQCTRNIQDRQNRQTVRLTSSNTADHSRPAVVLVVNSTKVWIQLTKESGRTAKGIKQTIAKQSDRTEDRKHNRQMTWTTDIMTGRYCIEYKEESYIWKILIYFFREKQEEEGDFRENFLKNGNVWTMFSR